MRPNTIPLLLLLAASACADTTPPAEPKRFEISAGAPRVITERALSEDAGLRLRSTDTAVLRLEAGAHPHADTGLPGHDVVPLEFEHDVRHTLCLRDDGGSAHAVSVVDARGKALGRADAGGCVTLDLAAGAYTLHLTSDGDGPAAGELAFVRPVPGPDAGPLGRTAAAPPTAPAARYVVPASYRDIPSDCSMSGPWNFDGLLCKGPGIVDSWRAYCDQLVADSCEARVADCREKWGDRWDGVSTAMKQKAWQSCFAGNPNEYLYRADTYFPIMQAAGDAWVQEYCDEVVRNDCAAEWQAETASLPACPATRVPYGELALQPGQIAVLPQSMLTYARTPCPPDPETRVLVLEASCPVLGRRIGGVVLGPETQAVLYPEGGYGGAPLLLENLGETSQPWCLPLPGRMAKPDPGTPILDALRKSASASVAVNRATGAPTDACRARRMGLWCRDGARPDLDVAAPQPGELLLLGRPDLQVPGALCAPALVVNTGCEDLSRLGFEDRIQGVIRPTSDTLAALYFNRGYAGKHTIVDDAYRYAGTDDVGGGEFQVLPDRGDPYFAGRDTASSLKVLRESTPDGSGSVAYNHTTLVSTGHCDECDLAGVDFSGEDLTGHSLVASDLTGANLTGANLSEADLGYARLGGVRLKGATLTGAHLGCAALAGVDVADPADPHRSTLTVERPATWSMDFALDGSTYACDQTDLSGARLPITLLPLDDWTALVLEHVALLDVVDGYALDGLDLRGGRYAFLSLGAKAVSMRGVNAEGADFRGAELSRVDFGVLARDGTRTPSNFARADFQGALLAKTNLEEADLTGADLSGLTRPEKVQRTNLSYAYMRNARLTGARMGRVNMAFAYFYGTEADVSGATMEGGVFDGGVFSGVDFQGCRLADASFSGAQLVNADFSGTGTDLTRAVFERASLQGATLAGADVTGASFVDAQVSVASGCWGYTDGACQANQLAYGPTDLGVTNDTNACPSGEFGPCVGDKLKAGSSATAPIPECIPSILSWDACMSYEVLSSGTLPSCEADPDVIPCGCLEAVTCGP